jgi:hypothetical protein
MTNEWDEEDEEEFGPGDPDYDLSEQHGYMWEEPKRRDWPVPLPVLLVVSVLVVIALVLPSLLLLWRAN